MVHLKGRRFERSCWLQVCDRGWTYMIHAPTWKYGALHTHPPPRHPDPYFQPCDGNLKVGWGWNSGCVESSSMDVTPGDTIIRLCSRCGLRSLHECVTLAYDWTLNPSSLQLLYFDSELLKKACYYGNKTPHVIDVIMLKTEVWTNPGVLTVLPFISMTSSYTLNKPQNGVD